jgi:dTDP-4-amino-4,6-dideoxygalactose transaminase
MDIKFNDFKRQYKDNKEKIDKAIQSVLESGWYILGPKVEKFEKDFAKYIGAKYSVGVANGMEALQISLLAIGVGAGDEVITTSHTAVATSLAISSVGATPVFVDIDDYFHIDADKIEEKITKKTKAIIPVHLYGQSVDLKKIVRICKNNNLKLVEDCAQSHGATYNNKKLGSFGTLGCFSFYPTKNLGAFGDGGAITTNDKKLYEKILQIRNYGQKNRYEHQIFGLNSRLDEIQAVILSVQLELLDKNNKKRQALADVYYKNLKDLKNIKLPLKRKGTNHVFHLFVIEADGRDGLMSYLKLNNIQSLIHYPIPVHKQECFKSFNKNYLPKLEKKVNLILSLPIHPFLTIKEIKYICKKIKEYYKNK